MKSTIRLAATIAAILIPLTTADRAQAQYGLGGYGGFGGFGGFGFGYNQNAYRDVNFLNQRSLINSQAAAADRPQPLQAPQYQTRDEGVYDRYDLRTRESMIDRVARDPDREMGTADPSGVLTRPASSPRPSTPAPSRNGPSEPRSVHLANFFDKDHNLVWPSAAPISGELGKKQRDADRAALAVLNEYDLKGLASVANVTDARRKLLDYGQPALHQVREQSTPALADAFHVFLLSLYGNLGAAATVPKER